MAFDASKYEATDEEAALFNVKPFDAEAARKQMIERIAKTLRHANNEQKMREPDFERAYGNGILYKPTLNGQRIYLKSEREDVFKTTSSKFASLLTDFSAAVNQGHFDDQLKAAMEAEKPQKGASTTTRATRSSSGSSLGKVAQPDNPEWMAKFEEKVGKPDASLKDPVPNSKGTKWIERSFRDRGANAAATRAGNA